MHKGNINLVAWLCSSVGVENIHFIISDTCIRGALMRPVMYPLRPVLRKEIVRPVMALSAKTGKI